jgi:hypothetical protein
MNTQRRAARLAFVMALLHLAQDIDFQTRSLSFIVAQRLDAHERQRV